MAKYLVTYSDQFNEIEINGFQIMTEKEYEHFEELAASINWDFTHKIGEQEIEFSSGDDFLTKIDYKEISNEEAKVIKKLFNNEYGVFIGESALESIIGEEEDIEEEEDDYNNEETDEDDDEND